MPHHPGREIRGLGLLVALAVGIALSPNLGHAQDTPTSDDPSATYDGEVVDRQSGDPVPSAVVRLVPATGGDPVWAGRTSSDGSFRTAPIPLGNYLLEVQASPFVAVSEPLAVTVEGTADLRIEMVGVDYELEPVVAVARRIGRLESGGVYERARQGTGYVLFRDDFEARNPQITTDILQRIPGVTLAYSGGSRPGQEVLLRRIGTGTDPSGRGCVPLFVMDGVVVDLSPPLGINEVLHPDALEAVEVHAGVRVPVQYNGLTNCGVIMLWTRDAGGAAGLGWLPTWKQALVGAAAAALAVFATR